MADVVHHPAVARTDVAAELTPSIAMVPSRALVLITPTAASDGPTTSGAVRPNASFIAQLLATRDLAPQTRTLRRVVPQEADIGYRRAHANIEASSPATGQRASRLA
jgi:hypothetical protein